MRSVRIGDAVSYFDPHGKERAALVTAVHGKEEYDEATGAGAPSVNIVFVHDDDGRHDTYGRQVDRQTSVVYRSSQPAHGNYWSEAA
jgi:hypothetical protein